MKPMKPCSSEFDLYESILSGSRQRFLPRTSSSNIHFEEIINDITTKKNNKLIKPDLGIRSQLKLVDESSFKSIPASDDKLIRSKDSDIPPPPDPKAEYFLSLIENEFDDIKKRAQKLLNEVQREKQICQFANQNIQKAKKLAIDSGHLSKLLKPENSDSLDDSNSYIIHVLGLFLIRSILYYQSLFEPYLKNPLDTEKELQTIVDNPYAFTLKGDYWKINFNKEETLIQNWERIRYIVHLLENPNKEFHCQDLTALVKGLNLEVNQDYSKMRKEKLEHENLSLVDLKIEMLSDKEKENIENMAYDAWEKAKNSSDIPNVKEKAKKEWEAVKGHLLKEYGIMTSSSQKGLSFRLQGRLKKDYEKARSNVTKHIKSAIKSIGKQIPSLSAHLKNAIHTGAKCCYQPDPNNPIKWAILWNN